MQQTSIQFNQSSVSLSYLVPAFTGKRVESILIVAVPWACVPVIRVCIVFIWIRWQCGNQPNFCLLSWNGRNVLNHDTWDACVRINNCLDGSLVDKNLTAMHPGMVLMGIYGGKAISKRHWGQFFLFIITRVTVEWPLKSVRYSDGSFRPWTQLHFLTFDSIVGSGRDAGEGWGTHVAAKLKSMRRSISGGWERRGLKAPRSRSVVYIGIRVNYELRSRSLLWMFFFTVRLADTGIRVQFGVVELICQR